MPDASALLRQPTQQQDRVQFGMPSTEKLPGAGRKPPASSLLPLIVYGVTVPCRRVRVKGGMRVHQHIYPHSPGAGIELLGRELYQISITPVFDALLIPAKYKDIWPKGLRVIREEMEKGTRKDITIPTVGTIPAVATSWDQEFDAARCLSGEEVNWEFLEDSENLRLASASLQYASQLRAASDDLGAKLAAIPKKSTNLWDQLMQAVDFVLSIRDQFELYSRLLESKLLSILQILKQLDATASELADPSSWPLVQSLHRVWNQTREFYQDQKQLGISQRRYTVKSTVSCTQLSTLLYGDSTHASELLQLNGFSDPFAILAGTIVKYYKVG